MLFWILLAGCGGKDPYLLGHHDADALAACTIAILPLQNKSSYPQGHEIIGHILFNELVQTNQYYLALRGDVQKIYHQLRIRPWMTPTPEQLRIIADRLGVEALIGGEVLQMKEQVSQGQVTTELKIQIRVYNGHDGTQVFACYHARKGQDYRKILHFGLFNTISALSEKVIQEILELWKEKQLLPCQG